MSAAKSPVITIIAGPTASGKSARAVEIARQNNGIVINADSMQVYNALPMLTAQPSAAEREAVPHALYGLLPPSEACSAILWRAMAMAEIEKAFAAGQSPVIVGGTGLYIEALTKGLSPIPAVPPAIRAAAMALQAELGNPAFHAELQKRDPVMADRLHPNDTQRLIRAFEVYEATGESLAHFQDQPLDGPPAHWRFEIEMILPERKIMHERCNSRFDMMMENGVLDEVEEFISLPDDAPVAKALGFRALREHLRGNLSCEEAVEQAKNDTRQYAKRQMTWFRGRGAL